MIRIGIVDPDTSHARQFARFLARREEIQLVGVCNESCFRSSAVVEEYAKEFNLEVFQRLENLTDRCDAALVLSADWERHTELATKLVASGIKVLIDKPVAGSVRDLELLSELELANPGMLFGGSALPFTPAIRNLKRQLQDAHVSMLTISGPLDNFFMSIHSSELLSSLLPVAGSTAVEATEQGMWVRQDDRLKAQVRHRNEGWVVEAETDQGTMRGTISSENVYDNYLTAFLQVLREMRSPSLGHAITGVRIELARSLSSRIDAPVSIEASQTEDGIASSEFVHSYKQSHGHQAL